MKILVDQARPACIARLFLRQGHAHLAQLVDVEVCGAEAVGQAANALRFHAFFEDGSVRAAGRLGEDTKLDDGFVLIFVVCLRDATGRELVATLLVKDSRLYARRLFGWTNSFDDDGGRLLRLDHSRGVHDEQA